VFTPEYTKELRDRLDGKEEVGEKSTEGPEGDVKDQEDHAETKAYEYKFKASSFRPATEEVQTEAPGDRGGEGVCEKPTVDDLDGEPLDGGGVDGVPMDDVDGEPLDGEVLDEEPLDGEPLQDEELDGEPTKNVDEDLDGDPMDEGVDGVHMHLD